MEARKTFPFRVALPSIIGAISLALMVWDTHNQRIIMSVGMGWDTGAPIWPYQTPDVILLAINAPAYLIANPFWGIFHLYRPYSHLALFPAILIWWHFVGRRIDYGLVPRSFRKHRLLSIFLLCLVAAFSLWIAFNSISDGVAWWREYSHTVWDIHNLIFVRAISPGLWFLVIGFAALIALTRLLFRATDRRPIT